MNDSDRKLLQMLIDGQAQLRKEVKEGFEKVNTKIDKVDKKLTKRIDNIGSQVSIYG